MPESGTRLALVAALALSLVGCEDDPRDLDHLRDAGGGAASKDASRPDAGDVDHRPDATTVKDAAGASDDTGVLDDAGSEDAGS
jgi:hypothetical protein